MKRAFTLIELLIVVAIIGILSAIIYVNWQSAQAKARDNKRKADLQAVSSAMTLYHADNKFYILRPNGATANSSIGDRIGYGVSDLNVLKNKNYITDLPKDPLSKSDDLCKYMYLQNNDTVPSQQYKLLSTSAETLGSTGDQCRSNAAEFANNQYSCKTLQVSSSTVSKTWTYSQSEIPADIAGCAYNL